MFKILGIIFALFIVLFIAIVIEECFLGGKRRRQLERKAREAREAQLKKESEAR